MKKDFEKFINTLQNSIVTWDYFCDFEKAHRKSFEVKVQLNILNSLLGEKDMKRKFLEIIKKYPETRRALLILIATRKEKINDLPIVNPKTLTKENKKRLFNPNQKLTEDIENELWRFFVETGLKRIFEEKKVHNLENYVFGVEVGLDSNARKNRTGDIMEDLVEQFVSDFCEKNELKYIRQATKTKILEKFNLDIKVQAPVKNKNGERKFDFAIFEEEKSKLTLVEVNYYSSTGSKPSSISREYIDLNNILKKEGIRFIWVTDGVGWKKMKNPLEKTIREIDYVSNLQMLKENVLEDIFKK